MSTQLAAKAEMFFVLGRKKVAVGSFKEASEMWRAFIDETNYGASECPRFPHVEHEGKRYRISYNGKVWGGKEDVDEVVVYSPFEGE